MDFHRIQAILQQEHTLTEYEWKGAVLFLCNEENLFFIQRSESMPSHGGQLAFVGGHKLALELNPWETAQREFEEETSLSREVISFCGYLPAALTITLQPIIPVVAKLNIQSEAFLREARSNGEWTVILSYPWKQVMNEDRWNYGLKHGYVEQPVKFHTLKAGAYSSPQGSEHPRMLWGLTAAMVWDLLRLFFNQSEN